MESGPVGNDKVCVTSSGGIPVEIPKGVEAVIEDDSFLPVFSKYEVFPDEKRQISFTTCNPAVKPAFALNK